MPSKKKRVEDEEEMEEDGPEAYEEDLDEMEDDMLADDDEDSVRSNDEVLQMLRDVECADCAGSSSRSRCKVRDEYGCPPEKAKL